MWCFTTSVVAVQGFRAVAVAVCVSFCVPLCLLGYSDPHRRSQARKPSSTCPTPQGSSMCSTRPCKYFRGAKQATAPLRNSTNTRALHFVNTAIYILARTLMLARVCSCPFALCAHSRLLCFPLQAPLDGLVTGTSS